MWFTFVCYLLPLVSQVPQSCVLDTIEVLQKCTNGSQFSTIRHIGLVFLFLTLIIEVNKYSARLTYRSETALCK